jgi:hypothetical protein
VGHSVAFHLLETDRADLLGSALFHMGLGSITLWGIYSIPVIKMTHQTLALQEVLVYIGVVYGGLNGILFFETMDGSILS